MKPLRTLSAAVMLATLFSCGTAGAADMLLDAPEVTLASATSGFYLRGDLGYAGWTQEGDPSIGLYDKHSHRFEAISFDEARFDKPFSGSIGIGYQISDMIRADLTGDTFEGRFDGETRVGQPCAQGAAGTFCQGRGEADYSAIGVMANGYVDFGTIAGFTPYLGAGVGATHLRWSDVSFDTRCRDGGAPCPAPNASAASYDGDSSWRLTYAVMAGVSYDLTGKLKLDLGYRYSDIADGDVFGGKDIKGEDDGLGRHEVRAGLRLLLY